MSIVTCATAGCSGTSWLTGPSRPVVATNELTPSSSGTPAATAAPNAISRMISVPPMEKFWDFTSSARSLAPRACCCDASPCSWTSSSGCAFWTAATWASGGSASVSSASICCLVSTLAGSENVTRTERPSLETVFARYCAFSGLWISLTFLRLPSRLTTSFTAAVT